MHRKFDNSYVNNLPCNLLERKVEICVVGHLPCFIELCRKVINITVVMLTCIDYIDSFEIKILYYALSICVLGCACECSCDSVCMLVLVWGSV